MNPPTALLTGPTGFLGNYLAKGLQLAGYQVTRLSRTGCEIGCDLACEQPDLTSKSFQLVVHAAGKAHSVPRTEAERLAFFQVNRNGTIRLLQALEQTERLPDALVLMSTVAVYGCEFGENIDENTVLRGRGPYAESKIQAEEVVQNWCRDNGVRCGILRLPLVVGKNPPGNLGAMVRAIRRGYYRPIGAGLARRSLVLAEDVARILPKVAQRGGIYNLTDGIHPTVRELSEAIAYQTGRRLRGRIPLQLARWLARIGDGIQALGGQRFPFHSAALQKMTQSLTFSDQKARQQLGWQPRPVCSFYTAVEPVFNPGSDAEISSVSVPVS